MTESQKKLAEDNIALVDWFINKHPLKFLTKNEYRSHLYESLCVVCSYYNSDLSAFSTYCIKCFWRTRFKIIKDRFSEKGNFHHSTLSLDLVLASIPKHLAPNPIAIEDYQIPSWQTEDVIKYRALLSSVLPTQAFVVRSYGNGESIADIAHTANCSRQATHFKLQSAIKKMRVILYQVRRRNLRKRRKK